MNRIPKGSLWTARATNTRVNLNWKKGKTNPDLSPVAAVVLTFWTSPVDYSLLGESLSNVTRGDEDIETRSLKF